MSHRFSILALAGCVAAMFCVTTATHAQEKLTFNRVFAPQGGLISQAEKPLRDELCLNGEWQFQPIALPADFKPNTGRAPQLSPPIADRWEKTRIRVPSPWNVNAFPYGAEKGDGPGGDFRAFPSYPASWEKADMGWLRRSFRVPAGWNGRRLILHFEAIAGASEIYINGKRIGDNFDLFLPFEFDVTDAISPSGENELLVGVRKADLFSQQSKLGKRPFVAGSMWGETIVGIWQDVYHFGLPQVRVSETLVQPQVSADTLQADLTLRNDTSSEQKISVSASVQPWVNLADVKNPLTAPEPLWRLDPAVITIAAQEITIPANGESSLSLKDVVKNRLKLWSPESPNLYGLTITLARNGNIIDQKYIRFGWREFKLTTNGLQLNGNPIVIKGDAWHFLGVPQMTRRYAWAWYKTVAAANGNCVRLHAQPYPRFYLEMADEMGMMILDETGIWGSGGTPKFDDPAYWANCDYHVRGLVMRDRNYPSVMGFSLTNEMLVVMRNRQASKEVMEMALNRYTTWINEIHKIDPTHQWLSGDGEDDAEGRLPVVLGHYGGMDAPKRWSKMGKPWGIGESGMAYYGTPRQAADLAGDSAYESMANRMQGVAAQAYQLITQSQIPNNATYQSVFNIVWYGLQPLNIGLQDTSRPPQIKDGVWFGPYVSGRPGMQPERLGPYCTTLNPGYDPSLPMYQTWPLFDAIKAAFQSGQPAKDEWSTSRSIANSQSTPTATADSVGLLTTSSNALKLELELIGVRVAQPSETTSIFVIDGANPPSTESKSQIDRALSRGATILVWRPAKSSLPALNALLPDALELTLRTSASLICKSDDPLIAQIKNAELYFAELKPDTILESGLSGPIVDKGTILLAAPAADWRLWNNRPEVIKTGSITRSERETKPSGAAYVVTPVGSGRIILANFSGITATPARVDTMRKLFTNMGLKLQRPRDLISGGIFSNTGVLRRALMVGRFDNKDTATLTSTDHADLPDGPAFNSPRSGIEIGKTVWVEAATDSDSQIFDLNRQKLSGSSRNANVYVSFWINSPRSLDDVLSEPDVPRVDLQINGSEKSAAVWLNGKLLRDDAAAAATLKARQIFPAMVLKRGWNHVMIKLYRTNGKWEFGTELRCSDPNFLSSLQAATEQPR